LCAYAHEARERLWGREERRGGVHVHRIHSHGTGEQHPPPLCVSHRPSL